MQAVSNRSSDDEDDNDDVNNLSELLAKFKSKNGISDITDFGNTEQYLLNVFNKESNICLVCIETIGPKDAIWNCKCCFVQFHLNCIQQWIRDGSYLNTQNNKPNEKVPWNCPKCREEYEQAKYPSVYYCYCGKQKNPEYDPWIIPHSCNQTCNKEKPCGHPCLMLCHPGPCPPCPKMVSNSCYCTKSSAVTRRCSNKHWSCNKECKRLLVCKQHYCAKICHPGDCPECQKTSIQYCVCKKFKKEVSCTSTIWKCEEICGKPYSCGHHKCELICHENEKCGPCPRSLARTCPCGKNKSQKPCTEDIPTCGDTCDKLLDCGMHKCVRRCHKGPCDTCRQLVTKRCRCQAHQKELPCCVPFTCDTKCNELRNCGKHKCNKKCCDGQHLQCEQICNKQLACKNHKCNMLCHRGRCYPCQVSVDLSCPCGTSKKKVPCAKSKEIIKISCRQLCKKPADCHHPRRQDHRCHGSDCPACVLKCDKLMKCGHICEAKCHSAVLTEIIENKIREGPWVPIKKVKKLMNFECPPCMEPIQVKCLGKHEISELPCYKSSPYNCGRQCGNMLKCTHHTCEFLCHNIIEEKDMSVNCEICDRNCEQVRPIGCMHPCPNGICHPDKCKPCERLLEMQCLCDNNLVQVKCQQWCEANTKKLQNGLYSILNDIVYCMRPTQVDCLGKHETSELPCHKATTYSCNRKCANTLDCTHHTCELECHKIIKENDASVNCETCERDCEQARPKGCVHPCPNVVCHPNKCKPCVRLLKMKCNCNNNFVYVECQKWCEANVKVQDQLKSCRVPCTKNIECGHVCTMTCHRGPCSLKENCTEKVLVKCPCKTLKKHLICNQMVKSNMKLECNEKCGLKKTSMAIDSPRTESTPNKSVNRQSNSLLRKHNIFLIVVSSLVLLVSYFLMQFLYTQNANRG